YDAEREDILSWQVQVVVFGLLHSCNLVRLVEAIDIQQTAIFLNVRLVRSLREYRLPLRVQGVRVLVCTFLILHPERYQLPAARDDFTRIRIERHRQVRPCESTNME